jgi:hypothetical protein|tara:strand:+ start:6424 stop:7416 length:993 start_codon:yes stop_codon:yes gene_type:complete
MRLSRRQLRRLIESALHEQTARNPAADLAGSADGLSGGGEAGSIGSINTGRRNLAFPKTYTYKNDGYTYVVKNDQWHVIKGKKKVASSLSDLVNLKNYPDSIENLDREHPEARTRDAQEQTFLAGLDGGSEPGGEQAVKKFEEVKKSSKKVLPILKSINSRIEKVEKQLRAKSARNQISMIDLDKLDNLVDALDDLTELANLTISNADRSTVIDPDPFLTMNKKYMQKIQPAVEEMEKLTTTSAEPPLKQASPTIKGATGTQLNKILADIQEGLFDALNDMNEKAEELKKIQSGGSSNSGGSTSGSSQVAVQREGLSRGELYRRRYWGRY